MVLLLCLRLLCGLHSLAPRLPLRALPWSLSAYTAGSLFSRRRCSQQVVPLNGILGFNAGNNLLILPPMIALDIRPKVSATACTERHLWPPYARARYIFAINFREFFVIWEFLFQFFSSPSSNVSFIDMQFSS
jgi:hypothetical protein